jgi:hypothetical protein
MTATYLVIYPPGLIQIIVFPDGLCVCRSVILLVL